MPLKIAMIGAGSIGFTRRLMHDLLAVPEFRETEFALTDISRTNLDRMRCLAERDVRGNGLPARITATTDRRRALAGADYVLCTIRQGGLEAYRTDIDIPLKYGIDQCVGDTLCAGGLMYAQRTIPALLDFCRDIREVAKPGARLLNYSNPMAMNTWACNKYGGVPTIGLCHGVQGAQEQIRACCEIWLQKKGHLEKGAKLAAEELDTVFSGINHQTWCVRASWRGMDLLPHLLEAFRLHPVYPRTEKVRIDVLERFGFYSTESNGHLSEYVPWYRKRPGEIKKWIDLSSWINGETGGYLRVCIEGRNWFATDYPNWIKEPAPKIGPENRSHEHGSWIIEALETGRIYRGHFNVTNQGHIPNLPDGCCIEIPGYVDRNGISMTRPGPLPLACAATCSASVRVQEMGMEAAVHGDALLLKQALLHDPLVGAVCDPAEVWQMADELLVAQARWLPQYRREIPAAKRRLAAHVRAGTRVKPRPTRGAARLKTRTVREMAREKEKARANAGAADKGHLLSRPRKA